MSEAARQPAQVPAVAAADKVRVETPFRRFVGDFFDSKVAAGAFAVLAVIIFIALFAPWISPTNPYDLATVDVMDSRLPPGAESFTGTTFWLGTDGAGRDLLSAMFYGIRTSLGVGVSSAAIALVIGCCIGLIAAYSGGRVDTLIMRVVDIQLSFPAILVALVLLAILGKGVDKIIIALVLVQWAYYARTMRGTALVERSKEYVEAATCLALGRNRIIFRHLLPNCISPLIVVGTIQAAHAIALEATLSFLGIGLPITEPSLGLLIANGFEYMLSEKYWISFFPGLALLVMIVSINLVGDQLRDVLNPRLQK
ncbi:MAG: ABC transporter permease [Hyphomicrobiales bacterium]|nr:ABC transporter permease [Hyphomicrobiales bacterium]MCP5372412.1 ABC transporter permease [Hyphomicrobiales bacterium]